MAKSRSESPLRLAFSLVSLRGAEGDEAISRVRQGEQNGAWPGRENQLLSVIARSAATKQSDKWAA